VEAVYVLDEDTIQQQSEGQTEANQIIATREIENTQIRLPRHAVFHDKLAARLLSAFKIERESIEHIRKNNRHNFDL